MTLDFDAKDKHFGQTMTEYFQTLPGELPVDEVGVWQIVSAGRSSFELSGDDLTEFVRLGVLALLQAGARPAIGGASLGYYMIAQPQYGDTNDEIADAVVAEWLANGALDIDPKWLWFALPEKIGTKIK